jgi:hypothetical protein
VNVGGGVLVGVFVGVLVGVFVGVLVGVFVGVLVGVLVGVPVGVFVGVLVGVFVGVLVGVLVGVFVGVLVGDGVPVGVFVGVLVGVFVGVLVGVFVGVLVGVFVGVLVGVFVGVLVGVSVGVLVGVFVGVLVGVGVGVQAAISTDPDALPLMLSAGIPASLPDTLSSSWKKTSVEVQAGVVSSMVPVHVSVAVLSAPSVVTGLAPWLQATGVVGPAGNGTVFVTARLMTPCWSSWFWTEKVHMMAVFGGANAGQVFKTRNPVVCPGVGVCARAGMAQRKAARGGSARRVERIEPLRESIRDPTFPEPALKRSEPMD